jgi:hypothetical protein
MPEGEFVKAFSWQPYAKERERVGDIMGNTTAAAHAASPPRLLIATTSGYLDVLVVESVPLAAGSGGMIAFGTGQELLISRENEDSTGGTVEGPRDTIDNESACMSISIVIYMYCLSLLCIHAYLISSSRFRVCGAVSL